MSAYRNAPVERWRVLYRVPLRERVGRGTIATLFAVLAATGPASLVAALFFDGSFALAVLGLMVSFTAAVYLVITWMTRMPETAVRTISALAAEDGRASSRMISDGERWTLPVRVQDLYVGQKLRVTYRVIAPQDDEEAGREVVEVRAVVE